MGGLRRGVMVLASLAVVAGGLAACGEPAGSGPVGSPVCSAPGSREETVIRTATNDRTGSGWAGADTAGATRLADGRVLWLYGDTWVGQVQPDGTRVTEAFLENSIGVQSGSCVTFAVGGGPGAWSPFFRADVDPTTRWWPSAAIEVGGRLYVGYGGWSQAPEGSIIGSFRGSVIAELDPATLAVTAVHATPWSGERQWGTGFATDGERLYVYGVDHLRPGSQWYLARWDGALAWEFQDAAGGWTPLVSMAAPLLGGEVLDGLPQVFPWLGGTALLTTEGLFANLRVRLWWSPQPAGPFQDLGLVAAIPDTTDIPSPFRYLGATLPAADGSLLLAWNVNSFSQSVLDLLGRAEFIRYRSLTLPAVGTTVAPPAPGVLPPPGPSGLPAGAGAFVALPPARLLDTRLGAGPVPAGGQLDLVVVGRAGVPGSGVTAVALNVTGVEGAPGFLTAWPAGRRRPLASALNLEPGDTRANLVVVAPGAGGAVSLFSQSGSHLVVDVAGYWTGAAGPVTAGRFQALQPSRLLDTRSGFGAPAGARSPASTVVLGVAGRGGVPAVGASAVALSVTATETVQGGFVTAFPGGATRPLASTLNLGAGGTRANLALVPLGPDGTVSLFTHAGGHLVVDVVGWFTGAGAPAATAGLFVPLPEPVRHLDSRVGLGGMARLGGNETRLLRLGGAGWVPDTASGVLTNLTVVDAVAPGFVTAWPAGQAWPVASNANVEWAGQVVPVATATRLGSGLLALLSLVPSHLVLDVSGWFL